MRTRTALPHKAGAFLAVVATAWAVSTGCIGVTAGAAVRQSPTPGNSDAGLHVPSQHVPPDDAPVPRRLGARHAPTRRASGRQVSHLALASVPIATRRAVATEPAMVPGAATEGVGTASTAIGAPLPAVVQTPAAPWHRSFTDDQPGRVEQLPGEAGYAFSAPLGTTVTTTVTTPTLTCGAVPPADRSVEAGEQITLELAGQYLFEQSFCFLGEEYNRFNVSISSQPYTPEGLDSVTSGVTGTFTETVYATRVVAAMVVPDQKGNPKIIDETWTIPGSFTPHAGGGFVGTLDEVYTSAGGTVPFTQLTFGATDADGEGLGAYLEAHSTSHGQEQVSVYGRTLRDQTSSIGTGSSFTISYTHLALPDATMKNLSVLQPATGTTTVNITVTLTMPSTYTIYISYAATGLPGRFDATSGTLTFSPGETTEEVPVTILAGEGGGNTTLQLYLSNPSYVITQGSPGIVTVKDVNVTRVAPDAGLIEGGNQVVVTGDNFTGATAVIFTPLTGSPVEATDFTVDSGDQISVTVPDLSGQLGDDRDSVAVAIQVQVGRAESVRTVAYLYRAVELAVSTVDPNTGPLAGGTDVTLSGSGFTWATDVVFTLADGKQFTVEATFTTVDGDLLVTSPPIPGNSVKDDEAVANVQVEADDEGIGSTSADTDADRFTYQGPVVDSVQPNTGPLAGGIAITITGANFTDGTGVVFVFANGTKSTVKATPVSPASMTVVTPPASAGVLSTDQAIANVEVRVTTDGASATSPARAADQFTYKGPRVTSLSQASGPLAGGTTLTVGGTGFTGATAVLFHFSNGSVVSVPSTATSNTSIMVRTPAVSASELSTGNAVADVEVEVAAADATSATSPATPFDQFTFQGPSVTGVSPSSGPAQGGTAVTVSGHGFTGATTVLFHFSDGTAVSVPASAAADTTLKVTTPEIPANELANGQSITDVEVEVAAGGDTTATSPASVFDHFTFQGPKVTKLSASSGPVQGGTSLTITGSNLSGASEVDFVAPDGTEYTVPASSSTATTVKVATPALPATELSDNAVVLQAVVEVPLTDATIALSPTSPADRFTMKGPSVRKVNPTKGLEGTTVTVSGSNFTDASKVTFTVGGVAYAVTPTMVTAKSLVVESPNVAPSALAKGTAKAAVQVDVPLPDSTTAVSPSVKGASFSYEGPVVTGVTPTSGPVAGGNVVTIKGKNLTGTTSVTLTIGSTTLRVAPNKASATSVTFTVPPVPASLVGKSGAKATVQVDVPAPSGATLVSAVNSKGHYTYRGPIVTEVHPTTGPSTGGTVVKVTGTNLTGANEVIVTVGKTVTIVTPSAHTATSVTFTTPAIASTLLHDNKALASVKVGVAAGGGSEVASPVGKASHFTYVGPS